MKISADIHPDNGVQSILQDSQVMENSTTYVLRDTCALYQCYKSVLMYGINTASFHHESC